MMELPDSPIPPAQWAPRGDLAAVYLSDIGWQILERNWRPNSGAARGA